MGLAETMDLIIVAGVSKGRGSQFSLKQEVIKDGMVMKYTNLKKYFGVSSSSGSYDYGNYSTPYLAGIYLYNYLTNRGINCGLINFLDLEIEQFKKYLKQNPKAIALSSTFLTSKRAVKKVTDIIRQHAPDIKVILGGPFIYNSYLLNQLKNTDYDTDSCAQDYFFLDADKFYYKDIDLFVIEEQGEKTLYQVISNIKKCKDYSEVPNLGYYKDDQLVFTARKSEDNSFTEDLVCWEDVPDEYLYPIFPMRGSRGCPYRCKYCNFAPCRTFRLKSPDIMAQEVAALVKTKKIRIIRFTDDNLFLTRQHVEDYCRKIIEVGKGIKWISFIRASSITKENVQLLKDSGCISVLIGVESGDRKILKEMNKKDTPEHYLEVIELLNTHGISTQLTFIIGYPGETPQTIENTVDFINQFHHQGPAVNEIAIFPFWLAPLSPIYKPENRRKYNLQGYMKDWSHYTMDSEQANKIASELFFRLENVCHHYGTEEFELLDISKLKEISLLRSKIRKAEFSQHPPKIIDPIWQSLRETVLSS